MRPYLIRVPSDTETQYFDSFLYLPRERISLILEDEQAEKIIQTLKKEPILGFDTESKPSFRKAVSSAGPHLFQFATINQAFLFRPKHIAMVRTILEETSIIKVGFDFRADLNLLRRNNINPRKLMDLTAILCDSAYPKKMVGVKKAVAALLYKRFKKSHKAQKSNWMKDPLTETQIIYAGNDAYAPHRIFVELENSLKKEIKSQDQVLIKRNKK